MRRSMLALLAAALAACASPPDEGGERFPTPEDYPPGVMEHVAFTEGGPDGWRLNSLRTPARPDAPWRIVVVTGTPSWPDYWAPTLAAAPENREMIVVTRPGFERSEPDHAVENIARQAEAIAPVLEGPPGQRVVLMGQSFGGPVATLLAAAHPERVGALVLVSGFFGERGPTADRLLTVGRFMRPLLPRDFRNSYLEVRAQRPQLPAVRAALDGLTIPVVFIHGDRDTFVPLAAAERLAGETGHPLIVAPGGDHFLNACCVAQNLAAVEQAIALAERADAPAPPLTQAATP